MKGKKMKVIRVTKKEFEVEGGQVFQHPVLNICNNTCL